MKKVMIAIMVLILILGTSSMPAFAGTRTCLRQYCDKEAVKGGSYCRFHTCAEPGCYAGVSSSNEKCEKHKTHYNSSSQTAGKTNKPASATTKTTKTCAKPNCSRPAQYGSAYCLNHKPTSKKSSAKKTQNKKDLDDLDIEGLYEDDPDDFENVEDAWDYLEDNPDEWGDYY